MGKRKILAVFLIVFTVMLSSFSFYIYQLIYTPNVLVDQEEEVIFTIPKGEVSFKELQNRLYDEGIVRNVMAFSLVAKVMSYDENIKPGHYTLSPDMTNVDLVKFLRIGNPPVRVSFVTARRISDLADHFEKYLLMDSASFMQYAYSPEAHERYGLDSLNIISLFLPDTHEFFYRVTPERLFDKMFEAYQSFWTEERIQKASNIGLTPQEVSVMASIVRGETAKMDEAARVAGVYMNRLTIGMRLQADPTLIFAQEDFSIRRVKKGDREVDSPFNTYLYAGLPPGPINMPTQAYVDAVLNVEDHNYLYFCADAEFNGYHVFARNYDDHLRNARKLWRALNEREIDR